MPVARTHFLCHCYHHIPGKPADLLSCWYCIPVGHTSSPPEPTGRRSSKSGRSYWHALTVDDDHYRHHFPYGYATDSRKIRRCMSPAQCYRSCCLSHAVSRQKGPACHPALHAVNSVGFHCTRPHVPEEIPSVRLIFFRSPVRNPAAMTVSPS